MSKQRKVTVFIAECPLCYETVQLVKKLSCPSCNVKIRNLMEKKKTDMPKQRHMELILCPQWLLIGRYWIAVKGWKLWRKTPRR